VRSDSFLANLIQMPDDAAWFLFSQANQSFRCLNSNTVSFIAIRRFDATLYKGQCLSLPAPTFLLRLAPVTTLLKLSQTDQ
jgi:hypothetical protein